MTHAGDIIMTNTITRNEGNAAKQTTSQKQYVLPPVNIREEKDAYVLEAEMPGVKKEALEITLEGSELTIIGRRAQPSTQGSELLREQRQADYRRVFEIDPAIDGAGITAKIHQGLLTVVLPKSEQIKPRKIAVNG
jgi:HSP20 family protein